VTYVPYSKQTWINGDRTKPISASRLNHIESGIGDISDYLDFYKLAVVFPGSNSYNIDDWQRFMTAAEEAQSKRLPLFIPPGAHMLSKQAVYESADASIFGSSAGRSRLLWPDGTVADSGLRVGPVTAGGPFGGPGDMPRGYIRDFSLWAGSSNGVPLDHLSDNTPVAGIGLQLSTTNCDVERMDVRGFVVGYDMVGNCYGTRWASCWAKYGWNHVGLLVRIGDQNGQDITYDNCWFSGRKTGVLIEPYTAGQHFRGGQISCGASDVTSDHDNLGALTIGLGIGYYLDGSVFIGGTRNCTFTGVNFEGTDRHWQIAAYEPHQSYVFQSCHFMGHGDIQGNGAPNAAAIAQGPLGVLMWNNSYDGTMTFDSCLVARYYKGVQNNKSVYGPNLIYFDGVQNAALRISERGTRLSGDLYVGNPGVPYVSNTRKAQGFDRRGLWANQGLPHHGEGSFGELQLGPMRVAGNVEGDFYKSADYGATWNLITSTNPPTSGTNEVNDAMTWVINHGKRFLQLEDRVYNNSAAKLDIPAGFRLEGGSHDTTVISVPSTGDPAQVGAYAKMGNLFLTTAGTSNTALGVSPAPASTGIVMQPKAHVYGCFLERFHAAFWLVGDHIMIEDCETFGCGIAVFRPEGPYSRGNLKLHDNRFVGCTFAALAVGGGTEEDNLESYSNHFGWSPYGWFAFPGSSTFGFTNVKSYSDSFESNGNRHVDLGTKSISGDMFTPGVGGLDASKRLANNTGTWSGVYNTGNGNYVFESHNADAASMTVSSPRRTSSDGKFSIHGTGGDTSNGPFLTPGSSGIFHTN
jgi:hypothetical protein